ncbi:SulP family inorganic anion transporter [bacterium]|nr:SulP family inorganic anion transporter [bacterium]
MKRIFPFLQWLPELRQPGVLRADVVAGITVALILVPQAIAYAE